VGGVGRGGKDRWKTWKIRTCHGCTGKRYKSREKEKSGEGKIGQGEPKGKKNSNLLLAILFVFTAPTIFEGHKGN